MAVWGGLTDSCEKKRGEKVKEKRKDISIRMQSSKEEQGEIRNIPQRPMQRNRGKQ